MLNQEIKSYRKIFKNFKKISRKKGKKKKMGKIGQCAKGWVRGCANMG